MANNDLPEGFQLEDPTDQDPQAGMASQGLNKLGHMAAEAVSDPVVNPFQDPKEQELGLQQPLIDPVMLAAGPIAGTLEPAIEGIVGNEVGSLGLDLPHGWTQNPSGAVQRIISSVGIDPKNFSSEKEFLNAAYNKAIGLINQGETSFKPTDLQVLGKMITNNPKKFADGGEVPEGFQLESSGETPQVNLPNQGQSGDLPPGFELSEDKYGTLGQQAKTALEGAAEGIAGPLAPLTEEKLLGVKPEDIRGRKEENPITHGLSQAGSLIASSALGVGEGALVAKAGELAAHAAQLAEPVSYAAKIASGAVKGAAEMGLLQSSDEVSKLIEQDPNQTLGSATASIGLYGLLGGGIGGAALSSISPLWKASVGNKLNQFIEDFKGRVNERASVPNPVESMTEELQNHYDNITALNDENWGPQGLKARDIAKAMPELSDKMIEQSTKLTDKIQSTLAKLGDDPTIRNIQEPLQKYKSAIQSADPATMFNATQELKQQLQGLSKYQEGFGSLADRPFQLASKSLAYDLRTALEDTNVWGKAAERQAVINGTFKKFKPSIEEFETLFMKKVADGENGGFKYVINPGKVDTYLKQLGKPSAAIKQSQLSNFLDKSQNYYDSIASSHANLGLDSPIETSPLSVTKSTLKDSGTGAKLADLMIDKLGVQGGGQAAGAAIGAGIGHATGIPFAGELGAMLGSNTLGPFFKSMLPAIMKPLLEKFANGESLKVAATYGAAIAKGEKLMANGVKDVFDAKGSTVLDHAHLPSKEDINKLKELLEEDPTEVTKNLGNNPIGHYMPDHGVALGSMAASAFMFLNSLKPQESRRSPLDSPAKPNAMQLAKYNNALSIAQQPLVVLDKLKRGTLTPDDLVALKNINPGAYQRLVTKVGEGMVEKLNKKEIIPYKTRIGLSMFLGQPLDSTLTSQGILGAQPQPQVPQEQQPQGRTPGRKPSVAATSKLNKLSEMNQTPDDSRQKRMQRVD